MPPRSQDLFLEPEVPLFDAALHELDLQDVNEIRLLLRGDSIVDWHKLGLETDEDVRRLLAVNGLDVDSPKDRERLDALRAAAVAYTRDTLGLRLDDEVATSLPTTELLLLASSVGRNQRQACTLLKVMHIIYHLDARELRTSLPITDSAFYARVERGITRMFEEMRAAGVPVVEFSWSHKTKDSLITKLLVKRETNAARVFDRLRFRVVVEHAADLLPTLHVMLRRFLPFNYVVPGQTVNTLIENASVEQQLQHRSEFSNLTQDDRPDSPNEFSGSGYRILNFVADLPVRVDSLLDDDEPGERGSVVFVLAEFQIIDREHAAENERGDNSHEQYKQRQHNRVRERLLREPKKTDKANP